jgi:hypothetical protein
MADPPEEDLREAERLPEGPRRPPEGSGRLDQAAETLAEKVRDLRKQAAKRAVKKRSTELQAQRDQRKATEGRRELKSELQSLRDRLGGVGTSLDAGAGAAVPRSGRDEDPIARAGREAESPAPVDASLRPFGGGGGVGPERLEALAGGFDRRRGGRGRAGVEREPDPLVGLVTGEPVDIGAPDSDSGTEMFVQDDELEFWFGGGRR